MSAQKYNFDEAINTFFVESREMLEDMESQLLDLENDTSNEDAVPAIFRAAHTIKGSAGMFGFETISKFTHVVENLLDDVRNDQVQINADIISILLNCNDYIGKLLDIFEEDKDAQLDDNMKSESAELLKQLNANLASAEKKVTTLSDKPDIDAREQKAKDANQPVESECWHISVRFGKDVFKNGLDPQSFISYLGKMGKIIKIKSVKDSIPPFEEIESETCYLGFEIAFMGFTTKDKIEEVFEFVKDDCTLRILPPKSDISEYVKLIQDLPEESMYIGEILEEIGSLTKNEINEALSIQESGKGKIGEIVVEQSMVQKPVVDAALKKQKSIKKTEETARKSIRIDIGKLDVLINQVGELVISAANIKQQTDNIENTHLIESITNMNNLINEIRDSSMNIRMVQMGDSFKRFERVVRDLSRSSGKEVNFKIKGGETELDKTLIEKVVDPVMHLVRNAVDHGIDMPEKRISLGKPSTGNVILKAFQESGNVVIEITDDGNGLSRDRIKSKAIEKGLLNSDDAEHLSDSQIFQYIFEPGFSTAEKVTNVSGRGVGMDVVKKNIDSLKGTVAINSTEGKGTSIRIYLPLTLAIIDGFLVDISDRVYVLPQNMISECIELTKKELTNDSGNFINLRGEIVPFIKLRDFFKDESDEPDTQNAIIIEYSNRKIGFIVDKPLGEFQTVVKPLGKLFSHMEWISGATILGNGEISLILDLPRLIQYTQVEKAQKVG